MTDDAKGAAQTSPENNGKPGRPATEPLVLKPRSAAHIDNFLNAELLATLLTACGSPLNVLFPQAPANNLGSFQEVLKKHKLRGKIFFAHKANQSQSLIRELALSEAHCDVASQNELSHALGAGFSGERLEATGPKNAAFIGLALLHGVVLNVDSAQELEDILEIGARQNRLIKTGGKGKRAKILLRVCGFGLGEAAPQAIKESRFGTTLKAVPELLAKIAANTDTLDFLGFSFHLDTTSLEEKIAAVGNCLTLCEEAVELGLEPRVLNIGGGFRINYLADGEDWTRFANAIKDAALGKRQLTWQNNFFGLTVQGGALKGNLNSYGYFETRPGADFLNDLLVGELIDHDNRRIADVLRDNMIELWLEPGRALLDLAGLTIARVNAVKRSSHGNTLVALNMKRQDLAFLDQEVFVDPLHFTATGAPAAGVTAGSTTHEVYLSGNLCLESDLIFKRKLTLGAEPEPGDIMVFMNTAAYMMDFSATSSIMQATARRIAVVDAAAELPAESGGAATKFVWMLDEEYTPLWRLNNGS